MIISIFNQKGGVAKTTTAVNLSAFLGENGKKVLLIDTDPQANSTVALGIDDENLNLSTYDLMSSDDFEDMETSEGHEEIRKYILKTEFGTDIIPTDITLSDADITLAGHMAREQILKHKIELLRRMYDYIIIDCPPSLGLLSVNALVASDKIIVPVSTSFFSIKAIRHLLKTVKLVQKNFNPKLDIAGFLITQYDARKNISRDIRQELREVFSGKVFNTVIRANVALEYAQDNQKPITHYDVKSHGYEDYENFCKELLEIE